MATIVQAAKDHWWTPLAVNILGSLFNDWQQRERNKKENALYSEALKQIQTSTQPQQNTGTGLPTPIVPESDNNNGWASAFHKTNTPLSQFDAATGLLGNTTQNPQPNRIPTTMDVYNVLGALAGTKRFASVTPERMQSIFAPYLKANEEARQEQRRRDAANAYTSAGNDNDRLNQLYASTILGVTPQALLNSAQDMYKYNNPYLQQYSQNTGATTRFGGFNPRTGEYNQTGQYENGLTPQQNLEHQFRLLQLEAQKAQQKAQMDYNYANLGQQRALENRRLDIAERPSYSMQAIDGKMYWADPRTGTVEPVIYNGEHLSATPNIRNVGFSAADKQVWNTLNAEAKDIQNEINRLEKRYKDEYREDEKQKLNTQITELRTKLAQKRQQAMEFFTGRSGQTSGQNQQGQPISDNNTRQVTTGMDIGANMLGVSRGTITTAFGAPRKKKDGTPYQHAGTDYAMEKDTPIRLDDLGTPMKVIKVANDPSGYGNYVDLEGTLTDKDGKQHKIGLRLAHMGNGTVAVTKGQTLKFGDLIGKVGNTGNSRGRNGGYHLHLETTMDGKRVNPATFKQLISPYIAHSKTLNPDTFSGISLSPREATNVTVEGRRKDTTAAYINPKTGKGISQAELEGLERKADNGDMFKNRDDLYEQLRKQGYERVEQNTASNPTQTTSDDGKFPITEPPTAQTTQPVTTLGSSDITARQEGLTAPSEQEEAGVRKAMLELNDEYNTWDDAYRHKYQFGSMSDFWNRG